MQAVYVYVGIVVLFAVVVSIRVYMEAMKDENDKENDG